MDLLVVFEYNVVDVVSKNDVTQKTEHDSILQRDIHHWRHLRQSLDVSGKLANDTFVGHPAANKRSPNSATCNYCTYNAPFFVKSLYGILSLPFFIFPLIWYTTFSSSSPSSSLGRSVYTFWRNDNCHIFIVVQFICWYDWMHVFLCCIIYFIWSLYTTLVLEA